MSDRDSKKLIYKAMLIISYIILSANSGFLTSCNVDSNKRYNRVVSGKVFKSDELRFAFIELLEKDKVGYKIDGVNNVLYSDRDELAVNKAIDSLFSKERAIVCFRDSKFIDSIALVMSKKNIEYTKFTDGEMQCFKIVYGNTNSNQLLESILAQSIRGLDQTMSKP